jgi:RNA polymerase sigma factor (TIGR02999 family)
MPQSITDLLAAAEHQEPAAKDALFAALYSELHRMARRELARPGSASTLGVTTLLHEAYMEIASREGARFPDRARFMAYAARVMRGLVIDHIRERRARKRGSQFEITALDTDAVEGAVDGAALSEIGQALDALAQTDEALEEVVDLKFFCGFSFGEIAAMRGISERTVQRQWEKARIYLYRTVRSDALS